MATKFYYRSSDGKYLGGFDGATPPDGSTEINAPPADGRMIFAEGEWAFPEAMDDQIVDEKRKQGYTQSGVTIDAMVVALWERVVEGRSESSDDLQTKRATVKTQNPKS